MIVHVLLLQARSNLSAYDEQELGEAIYTLRGLPVVQSLTWGPDFSGRGKGYTHAAVMTFADRGALRAYTDDPEHKRIIEVLNRLAPERLVIDYEVAPE